ncbi:MAG: putative Fe-S cluster assembly protein SufT [Wenzhouxiangellaceae bacterium]
MHGFGGQPVRFERDAEVIMIPAGDTVTIPVGTVGYLTQSLGGSFTIYVEGNLFRLAGEDADAIGREPVAAPSIPDDASEEDIEALLWQQLKTCYDPEIPVNIVDLGLIYRCDMRRDDEGRRIVDVDMTLTAPGCGMGDVLAADVKSKLEIIPVIHRADVQLVFDPPWNYEMMSEVARLETGMM